MSTPSATKESAKIATPTNSHEETDEELIARFRQQVDNDEEYLHMLLTTGTAHTMTFHVGTNYPNILQRALIEASQKKPKFSNSTFQTDEDCLKYVKLALKQQAPRIIKWLRHKPEQLTQTIIYNTKNKIIGYGFEFESAECNKARPTDTDRNKPSIYEYESHACHVELMRPGKTETLSDDILKNIRISTAYPQMGERYGINLHSDLRGIIQQTQTYVDASPAKKAWFDYISNDPEHAVYPAIDDNAQLQIYVPDPPRENTILIGKIPDECILRAVIPNPRNPTPLIATLLATGKFPKDQTEFHLTPTVRDVLASHHKTQLKLADYLYEEIQKHEQKTNPAKKISIQKQIVVPEPTPPSIEEWCRHILNHRADNRELAKAVEAELAARKQENAAPVARIRFCEVDGEPMRFLRSEAALFAYVRDVVAFHAYAPDGTPTHRVYFMFLAGPKPETEYEVIQAARSRIGLPALGKDKWLEKRKLEIKTAKARRVAKQTSTIESRSSPAIAAVLALSEQVEAIASHEDQEFD